MASKIKPLRQLAQREQSEEHVTSGVNKIQTTKVNNRSYSLQRSMGIDGSIIDTKPESNVSMPPINRGLSQDGIFRRGSTRQDSVDPTPIDTRSKANARQQSIGVHSNNQAPVTKKN